MSHSTMYRSQVDLLDPWSITYWTVLFGVSDLKLREAVQAVGPSPDAIRQYLMTKPTGFVRPKFQIAGF